MKAFARWLIVLTLFIAACSENGGGTDSTDPNGAILVGENAMPKQLATVVFTATPPEGSVNTPVPTFALPTDFPDEEPTFTPTAIVGVFVGTAVNGTPESVAIAPVVSAGNPGVTTSGGAGVLVGTAAVSGTGNCPTPVAETFRATFTRNSSALQVLGCPNDSGNSVNLVYQAFERGKMFWRDTRQIYILQPNGGLLILPDSWQEGLPASDDAYVPPSSNLLQPVRGFGFVWRSNETIRNNIGWATQGESPIPSFWQTFENGALFIGDGGAVYAIIASTSSYIGPL